MTPEFQNKLDSDAELTASELGQLADLYWVAYQDRLAADKVAAALKSDESKHQARLMAEMQRQGLSAVGGARVRLTLSTVPEYTPAVKDWAALYAYIKANDAWDMLEKRPGKLASRARWDEGEIIPGVEKFPVYKLSKSEVKK